MELILFPGLGGTSPRWAALRIASSAPVLGGPGWMKQRVFQCDAGLLRFARNDGERTTKNLAPSLRGALAPKQSSLPALSAPASPNWVRSSTQATYPSGRINTGVGSGDRANCRKLPRTNVSGVDPRDPIRPWRDVDAAGLTEIEPHRPGTLTSSAHFDSVTLGSVPRERHGGGI